MKKSWLLSYHVKGYLDYIKTACKLFKRKPNKSASDVKKYISETFFISSRNVHLKNYPNKENTYSIWKIF